MTLPLTLTLIKKIDRIETCCPEMKAVVLSPSLELGVSPFPGRRVGAEWSDSDVRVVVQASQVVCVESRKCGDRSTALLHGLREEDVSKHIDVQSRV